VQRLNKTRGLALTRAKLEQRLNKTGGFVTPGLQLSTSSAPFKKEGAAFVTPRTKPRHNKTVGFVQAGFAACYG